jgi:hypothetical protein
MKALKGLLTLGSGLLAAIYLANPGAGLIEIIPDNIPIIGNLDEVGATLIFLNCLAYFGIDLRRAASKKRVGTNERSSTK